MKRLGLVAILAGLCMYGFAQQSTAPEEENSYNTQENSMSAAPQWSTEKTADFVRTALMNDMMEKQLGKMAAERGNSPEVKNLGTTIAEGNSDANMKLQDIARSMNVDVPQQLDQEHQKKLDELKTESSNQFTQDFLNTVIKSYQKNIESYQEAKNMTGNDQLNSWIESRLPELQKHLSKAQNLQKSSM